MGDRVAHPEEHVQDDSTLLDLIDRHSVRSILYLHGNDGAEKRRGRESEYVKVGAEVGTIACAKNEITCCVRERVRYRL